MRDRLLLKVYENVTIHVIKSSKVPVNDVLSNVTALRKKCLSGNLKYLSIIGFVCYYFLVIL